MEAQGSCAKLGGPCEVEMDHLDRFIEHEIDGVLRDLLQLVRRAWEGDGSARGRFA